jgi:hypothetical protein
MAPRLRSVSDDGHVMDALLKRRDRTAAAILSSSAMMRMSSRTRLMVYWSSGYLLIELIC